MCKTRRPLPQVQGERHASLLQPKVGFLLVQGETRLLWVPEIVWEGLLQSSTNTEGKLPVLDHSHAMGIGKERLGASISSPH